MQSNVCHLSALSPSVPPSWQETTAVPFQRGQRLGAAGDAAQGEKEVGGWAGH
jgi:hypothetical protein